MCIVLAELRVQVAKVLLSLSAQSRTRVLKDIERLIGNSLPKKEDQPGAVPSYAC